MDVDVLSGRKGGEGWNRFLELVVEFEDGRGGPGVKPSGTWSVSSSRI